VGEIARTTLWGWGRRSVTRSARLERGGQKKDKTLGWGLKETWKRDEGDGRARGAGGAGRVAPLEKA